MSEKLIQQGETHIQKRLKDKILDCRITVAPPKMTGKPCAFCTSGTETWAPLMNSWVYLAKRRNPSVIWGCWLPVETWHCSQALKWIKKNARGKRGMQGQRGETGNIERSGLLCLQRDAKRKQPLSLESEVHWPAVCSVGGWYSDVPGGGDFGTFCLSCDDCWEAATLAFREVQGIFVQWDHFTTISECMTLVSGLTCEVTAWLCWVLTPFPTSVSLFSCSSLASKDTRKPWKFQVIEVTCDANQRAATRGQYSSMLHQTCRWHLLRCSIWLVHCWSTVRLASSPHKAFFWLLQILEES